VLGSGDKDLGFSTTVQVRERTFSSTCIISYSDETIVYSYKTSALCKTRARDTYM